MSITDIIPDIHGQAEKLRLALKNLGWRRNGTTWKHPEPDRQIVFLGDFIDRGPENAAVIRIVRELMDAGRAQAIMPDLNVIPDAELPDNLLKATYPVGDKPVFFGHYWMSGEPELQSVNALCLDYSAGTVGPLVTYRHIAGSQELSLEQIITHQ